jgi:ion channel POLLUX/CASTOR
VNTLNYRKKILYQFDNTMSKGTIAIIAWLFVLAVVMITAVSLVIFFSKIGFEDKDFLGIMWVSLLHTLNTGVVSRNTGSWVFLLLMFATTLGGIFIVSILIGLLTTGIKNQLEDLRKGRSFVAEEGHTVILGWSSQIFTILSELIVARQDHPYSCIAILAQKDKVEMEDAIRNKVGSPRKIRIVCRTGNPVDLDDLEIVNPDGSRSIIVLPPDIRDSDIFTVKIILALTNKPGRRSNPYYIVAPIKDPKNLRVAQKAGRDEIRLILTSEVISHIAAQTCHQSGLSVVYGELLSFKGDTIYFKSEPGLSRKTFGDALSAYEDCAVIGLHSLYSGVKLNPPMDTVIREGDEIVLISADDESITLAESDKHDADTATIRDLRQEPSDPEKILVLGWNHRAPAIIKELDAYLVRGSQIHVVADIRDFETTSFQKDTKNLTLTNAELSMQQGDTTDRSFLDDQAIHSYNSVIVLSYIDTLDPEQADSRTLITLLHLRDINEETGHEVSIVTEMLDIRNRDLAEVARADDYIISERLTSLILSQVSENDEITAVFDDLFNPEGSEIYMKPVEMYIDAGKPVNFYTLVESARRKGEVAIGYRIVSQSHDKSRNYGIIINPQKLQPIRFTEGDQIIVLAEG